MQKFAFTFEVTAQDGVTAAEALKWLHRTLEEIDLPLPDTITSVQTIPTYQVTSSKDQN